MASSMGPAKMVTDGLVLHLDAGNNKSYPGSGTVWTDLSSTAITGSLTNGPTFSSVNNGAILFDGTNDYVDFGNVLSFERTSPFTISTWFRTSRAGSFTSTIVGKQKLVVSPADYSGYQVGMNTVSASSAEAGKFGFSMVSSPFTSVATNVMRKQTSASYNNDTWVNGVVTYDGSSNRSGILIYMNGVSVLTEDHDASSLSLSITSSVNFEIGARDGTQQPFTGSIGQVQIYNRALSANEVFQNYEATRERFNRPTIVTDDDARNFLNSANISSETQQRAVNDLVVDMKNAGLWGKMKAIYPFVGGTAASHKWNLKDPRDVDAAFRLTFSGGWTHSSTGATPNGTNAYADTYLISANSLNVDSAAVSVYLRTNDQGTYYMDLCDQDTARKIYLSSWFFVSGFGSNGVIAQLHTGGFSGGVANTDPRGFYLSSRTGNTVWNVYKNNAKISARTVSSSAADQPIKSILLAGNILFSAEYSTRQQAFATISDGLTDTDAANLYTIVQKYQTTLGRQV